MRLPWPQLRIAIVMPRYFHNDSRFAENIVPLELVDAARAGGHEVLSVEADDITYPQFMNLERCQQSSIRHAELAERLKEFRPDILVIDVNATGDADTLNIDRISRFRAELNVRVVGFFPDFYDKDATIQYWAPAVDLFIHGEPSSSIPDGLPEDQFCLVCYPSNQIFDPIGEDRDIPCLFLGSQNYGTNTYRELIIATLLTEIPGAIATFTTRLGGRAFSDIASYAAAHRRSRCVVNSGRRLNGQMIITLRDLEAIRAGAVLVTEAGSPLEQFFQPGRHYLTYRSMAELVEIVKWLENEPAVREQIATEAQEMFYRNYAPSMFWNHVWRGLEARSRNL